MHKNIRGTLTRLNVCDIINTRIFLEVERSALMTDKELRKLKRSELLEILYFMRKEMDSLRQENEQLRSELISRPLDDNVGEILSVVRDISVKTDKLCGIAESKRKK